MTTTSTIMVMSVKGIDVHLPLEDFVSMMLSKEGIVWSGSEYGRMIRHVEPAWR